MAPNIFSDGVEASKTFLKKVSEEAAKDVKIAKDFSKNVVHEFVDDAQKLEKIAEGAVAKVADIAMNLSPDNVANAAHKLGSRIKCDPNNPGFYDLLDFNPDCGSEFFLGDHRIDAVWIWAGFLGLVLALLLGACICNRNSIPYRAL